MPIDLYGDESEQQNNEENDEWQPALQSTKL